MTRLMFGFDGRIGRLDYFLRWLLLVAATMLSAFSVALAGTLGVGDGQPVEGIGSALTTFGYLGIIVAMLWSATALAVRRGHDIGWPAWLTLVPVLGLPALGLALPAGEPTADASGAARAPVGVLLSLAPTLMLTVLPGSRHANAFGPPIREPAEGVTPDRRPFAG